MARKYRYHRWYSVMWIDDNLGSRIHCYDLLTKKEAKSMAAYLYSRGAYRVDIMKRVYSRNKTIGEVNLEKI